MAGESPDTINVRIETLFDRLESKLDRIEGKLDGKADRTELDRVFERTLRLEVEYSALPAQVSTLAEQFDEMKQTSATERKWRLGFLSSLLLMLAGFIVTQLAGGGIG